MSAPGFTAVDAADLMAAVKRAIPEATVPQMTTVARLAAQMDPGVARVESVYRVAGHRLDPGDISVAMVYRYRDDDAEDVEVVTIAATGVVSDSVDYG